jgi:hypothetical protein
MVSLDRPLVIVLSVISYCLRSVSTGRPMLSLDRPLVIVLSVISYCLRSVSTGRPGL